MIKSVMLKMNQYRFDTGIIDFILRNASVALFRACHVGLSRAIHHPPAVAEVESKRKILLPEVLRDHQDVLQSVAGCGLLHKLPERRL